jgi:hypothetical protein
MEIRLDKEIYAETKDLMVWLINDDLTSEKLVIEEGDNHAFLSLYDHNRGLIFSGSVKELINKLRED